MTTAVENKPDDISALKDEKRTSLQKGYQPKKKFRIGRTISISFDKSSLQLVTTRKSFKSSKLIDITKVYIPKNCNTEKKTNEFLSIEINRYLNEFSTRGTTYILGISGKETTLRTITLPLMPNAELKKAIYWEGNKRIPFGLDNAYYDYQFIDAFGNIDKDSIVVSLMAVSKEIIDKKLELLKQLNIAVSFIYQELESLGYLLSYLDNFDAKKPYTLINIEKSRSEISFYRGNQLEFMNISSVGSQTLTDNIDNKVKYDFFTESLVNEISNTLDFYGGQFSTTSTETVFIYGDLSYSTDLTDSLTDRFGIEFKPFPIEHMKNKLKRSERFSTELSVSLGGVALAIHDYEMINFLPPKMQEADASNRYRRMTIPLCIIFTVMLMTIWMMMKESNKSRLNQLTEANKQIEQIENSSAFIKYNQIKSQMAAEKAILEKLYQEPTFLNLNLKELTRITPDKVWLNMYDLQNLEKSNFLMLSGQVESSAPPPEIVLAEFVARLESSPFFENILLKRHVKNAQNGQFTIDFLIEMNAVI